MDFSHRWIDLIMSCVRAITYLVVSGNIVISKGLRQGDNENSRRPFVFIYFLLCTNDLVSLMKKAIHESSIEGIVAGKGGPRVSKLFLLMIA